MTGDEHQRIPARAMAEALERMADGKTSLFGRMTLVRKVCNFAGSGWLADFGRGRNKRPDHEIAPEPALRAVNPKRSFHELQKRRELTVLQQAAFDYGTRQPCQEERLGVSAADKTAEARP